MRGEIGGTGTDISSEESAKRSHGVKRGPF